MRSQERGSLKNIGKHVIAGILMIIVFVMTFIDLFNSGSILYVFLIFGAVTLVGAIFAIKRVFWPVALIGSIIGIFTFGPYYSRSILSIVALLFLIKSGDKFIPVSKSSEHFVDAGGFGRRQGGGNLGGS